ncbi:MAG: tRNA uridine-5-carboxymethylaminomethyl(34) synthesis GTPase MnmE, partial [Oscillospiraceae bacterium]
MEKTIAAIATANGVGGIAVVRISGEGALEVCEKVFLPKDKTKNIKTAKGYTAMFGHFLKNGKMQDEVVALFFRAPKSYTGEDVVELSCHG